MKCLRIYPVLSHPSIHHQQWYGTWIDRAHANATTLQFLEFRGLDIPVFISGTLVNQSGQTLSDQTGDAFCASVSHAKPICFNKYDMFHLLLLYMCRICVTCSHHSVYSVGLNCALGAQHMIPFLECLVKVMESFIHMYSNAECLNAMGGYNEMPEDITENYKAFFKNSWLNMVRDCCRLTPAHIKYIGNEAAKYKPC